MDQRTGTSSVLHCNSCIRLLDGAHSAPCILPMVLSASALSLPSKNSSSRTHLHMPPDRYITERAVFRLKEGPDQGLELLEVAPGVDLQKDVLDHMDFQPTMKAVKTMDPRCFLP